MMICRQMLTNVVAAAHWMRPKSSAAVRTWLDLNLSIIERMQQSAGGSEADKQRRHWPICLACIASDVQSRSNTRVEPNVEQKCGSCKVCGQADVDQSNSSPLPTSWPPFCLTSERVEALPRTQPVAVRQAVQCSTEQHFRCAFNCVGNTFRLLWTRIRKSPFEHHRPNQF